MATHRSREEPCGSLWTVYPIVEWDEQPLDGHRAPNLGTGFKQSAYFSPSRCQRTRATSNHFSHILHWKSRSQSPSSVHITSQNELVIKCHFWDVIAETAHSGLNEVGRNLDGLARWLEMLSKLNATPEQGRQALLCSLAERPSYELSNGSHFEDWLQFLCFTCTVGKWKVWRDFGLPYARDIQIEQLKQGQEPMETVISRAQEHFAMLGYTFSSDTIKNWSGEGTRGICLTPQYLPWYWDMTRHAMQYGHMLRDNNPTRRLLRTALTNMLGTGPQEAQPGDVIVLVECVNVPYLLRRVRDGKFELIGEAYIHDLEAEERCGICASFKRVQKERLQI
jgi:hypothetical protein